MYKTYCIPLTLLLRLSSSTDAPRILGETVTEIIAIVGDVIRLPCNATGEPLPEFLWSHNHKHVSYNDHM